jgi:allophanate hydrolase subunit 1
MGDRGFSSNLGDEISLDINEKVRRMALAIRAESIEGLIETHPDLPVLPFP